MCPSCRLHFFPMKTMCGSSSISCLSCMMHEVVPPVQQIVKNISVSHTGSGWKKKNWIFVSLGLYSLSGKTSYRQISWSLEAARLGVMIIAPLRNLTGSSAALLPRGLSNFRAIGKVETRISRLRDFTRPCSKTSYRLVNRGPDYNWILLKNNVYDTALF